MSAPAATVDSLVKFSYKKKFSFTNRKSSVDEQPDEVQDGGVGDHQHNTTDSVSAGSDESFEPATVTAKAQHKGSARLKESGDSSDSSSDSGPKKSKKKKTKDVTAKASKKKRVKKNESDESSEDEDARKVERQLAQLYKMFPSVSQSHIKQMYIKRDFDAKSCIDTLLEEVNGGNGDKMADEADDIEEWSDGDAEIKAKNEQARAKKLAAQSSVPVTDQQVKRKSNEDLNREPQKKKARKLVILSDDDDEVESTSVKSKQSSASSLNSLASSGAEKVSKKTAKKSILRSSSDQDEEEEVEERSSKKSKKHKKEKKKHKKHKQSRRDDEEAASDQSDNEFAKRGADYDTDDSADEEDKMTDEEKAAILSMLNDASSEDIQSMINISAKRVSTLMSLRPFKNYEDLVG